MRHHIVQVDAVIGTRADHRMESNREVLKGFILQTLLFATCNERPTAEDWQAPSQANMASA